MARFVLPKTIKHRETKLMIKDIVRNLQNNRGLDFSDVPQLHRMATAYDTYLECVEVLSKEGFTMINNKGETVKRPEANLLKENWSQYLELAKEYGMTPKSLGKIKNSDSSKDTESPFEKYIKGANRS